MDILSKFTSYLAFWGRREGERRGRGGGGEGMGREEGHASQQGYSNFSLFATP